MRTVRSIVIGLAVTALSTSVSAHKISYDYRRGQNFSTLKTFSFTETAPIDEIAAQTTLIDDPITKQQTEAAIARQLQARGMVRDDAHPDVLITTRRTFNTEYLYYGPSGWWGWGGYGYPYGYGYGYGGPWYSYPYIVGTLTVDVSNAHGELLWRGICEATAHPHEKPAERSEHITKEVTKVFKKFPPTGAVGTTGHD